MEILGRFKIADSLHIIKISSISRYEQKKLRHTINNTYKISSIDKPE